MPVHHTIPVQLSHAPYSVHIGPGLFASVGEHATQLGLGRRCAIITDSTVGPLYSDRVRDSLEAAGFSVLGIQVPAGEVSKSMSVVEDCCRQMIRGGLDRKAWVFALGGGVIGDLAGFVASIYFRGIPFIQSPTTIVAFTDSAVGGKTGVNTPEGKNLLGAFHQPVAVLGDSSSLATLPAREFNEGMAEAIKHAAIRAPEMLDTLLGLPPEQRQGLDSLIAQNVAIKAAIVAADEKETRGLRALLNFGHTLGHAIEAEAGYGKLLHGEAISLGLRAALWLSERKAGLDPAMSTRVLRALQHYQLPLVLPEGMTNSALLGHLAHDKKFEEGAIRFVLLRTLGDAYVANDINTGDLNAAIDALRTQPAE